MMTEKIQLLKQMRTELLERVDALDFAIRTLERESGTDEPEPVSKPEPKNRKVVMRPDLEQFMHPDLPKVGVGCGIRLE